MRKLLVFVVVRHAKNKAPQTCAARTTIHYFHYCYCYIIIARRAQIIKHKSPFKLRFCPAASSAAQIRFQIRFSHRCRLNYALPRSVCLSVSPPCLARHDDDQNLQMFSACSYKMPQSKETGEGVEAESTCPSQLCYSRSSHLHKARCSR